MVKWLSRKKEERVVKKCEHKWVFLKSAPESSEYCHLCNELLIEAKKMKCELCGEGRFNYEKKAPCYIIHFYERPENGEYFCQTCYEKFTTHVDDLCMKIKSSALYVGKVEHVSESKVVFFGSVDRVIAWLKDYAYGVSEPYKDSEDRRYCKPYGIAFYVFPKDPLATTYRAFIPYKVLAENLKRR